MLSNRRKKIVVGISLLFLLGCQSQNHSFSEMKSMIPSMPAQDVLSENSNKKTKNLALSESIDLKRAIDYVLKHSDTLLAAQSGAVAAQLQSDALDLHQPTIILGGVAGRYNIEKDFNISGIKENLSQLGSPQLAHFTSHLSGIYRELAQLAQAGVLPQLPDNLNLKHQDHFATGYIAGFLPIYTGGKIEAIQDLAQGRADSAITNVLTTKEHLISTLIERYFLVQLAKEVVKVRNAALKAVQGHHHSAKRMFELGVISKIQKLQAEASLAEARFQFKKANNDLRLAQSALNSLVKSNTFLMSTPLFISSKPLSPLIQFQAKAQQHSPIFAEIKAKRKQANALKTLSESRWKPNVGVFGTYLLGEEKDWLVGVNASMTLNSAVDRKKMYQAAKSTLTKVDALYRQAQKQINLYVEKSWLAVEDAKARYFALGEEEKLAKQVLVLQQKGFKQGVNTIIELNDAQANLIKIQTQRAKTNYEYVMALTALLASTGHIQDIIHYIPTLETKEL